MMRFEIRVFVLIVLLAIVCQVSFGGLRLTLEYSADLESWEPVEITEAMIELGGGDDPLVSEEPAGLVIEREGERGFYRLRIRPLDAHEIEDSRSVGVDGDYIVGRLQMRTNYTPVVLTLVRDALQVPVPWEDDDRIDVPDEEAAHEATTEALQTMEARLSQGVFERGAMAPGDVLEIRRRWRDTENKNGEVEE